MPLGLPVGMANAIESAITTNWFYGILGSEPTVTRHVATWKVPNSQLGRSATTRRLLQSSNFISAASSQQRHFSAAPPLHNPDTASTTVDHPLITFVASKSLGQEYPILWLLAPATQDSGTIPLLSLRSLS
ncbi:hypothetical protein PM082_009398 [Marasmius tenuissimus]|nr:hypothetical protein PM082_009398 [Marasmius tenuissimus]